MIQNLPREYDSKVGDQGMLLSGGQRQRVGLARAMFGNPRLLVLDEPNAHLDTAGEAALNQAIVEAKKRNCIVLVVAHRPQILQFVDKVLILSEGTVQNFTDRENVIVPVAKQSPAQIPAQEKPATKQPAQDDNATKTAASGTPGSDKSNAQKSTS